MRPPDTPRPAPGLLEMLVRDDGTGVAVAHATNAGAKRLHRCRRGNISVLVLCMGLVFYGLAAMVWNTGQVTSAKIEAQTAADAAAYSAAVWTSRALNLATGTNMLVLQHSTAITASLATIPALVMPWVEWIRAANQAAAPCGPAYAACFAAFMGLIFTMEILPMYIPFAIEVVPTFIDLPGLFIDVWDLHQYQLAWMAAVPDAIDKQTAAIEDYYDCDIEIVRGDGATVIAPPLAQGHPGTFVIPYFLRAYWEMWRPPNGWRNSEPDPFANPPEGGFSLMFVGKAKQWYERLFIIPLLVGYLYGSLNHVYLASTPWYLQTFGLEAGPGFLDRWETFTVVAAARKREDNTRSAQPPRYPLRFMAKGLFKDPVTPVAYAQAETFNGIDGHLPFRYLPYPYRVWTTWGWQWQPRLTHGDLVPELAPTVFDFAGRRDVRISSKGDVRRVTTH